MTAIMAVFGMCVAFLFGVIAYYHFFPAKLADITLSNGKQTVYFLQMSHIASEGFYAQKHQKISQYANSGATILMEGVGTGSPENMKKLHDALSFELTDTLYDRLAGFLGLVGQDHDVLFRDIQEEQIQHVDLSVDDMIGLMATGNISSTTGSEITPPIDMEAQIALIEESASPREKRLYQMILLTVLNAVIGNASDLGDLGNAFPPELYHAIVTHRNQRVVDYILAHPQETIVVPYGALHFDGIFRALQQSDPEWKVLDIEETVPYPVFP